MKNNEGIKRIYCVISHTHWDREWYLPFEQFRLRLVDLIDRLLDITDSQPEYIFHLDAQTVVLEDYLEIRRENGDRIKNAVKRGQIIIGPWYLQNDFFLTSGEATVRNLAEGIKIAEEYGRCSNVGYAADQFGNISQLPQILKGFGIDNFIFGRGFGTKVTDENGVIQHKIPAAEFRWRGPDGSEVLAINMKDWYNNAQRFSEDIEKSMLLMKRIEDGLSPVSVTPYLLLMNGADHLEPQDNLFPILEKINERLPETSVIEQTTLDTYVENVKGYIEENNISLYEHSGELRMGHDGDVLNGTLSSRPYLKIANDKIQNRIEQQLEPLYSLLEMSGCKGIYSNDHFRFFWKKLMKNHPHDSICCCSRDEVHKHMEDRFEELEELTGDWLERGLNELAYRSPIRRKDGKDYMVTVFNPLSFSQSGVVESDFKFMIKDGVKGFHIEDKDGNNVPFYVSGKRKMNQQFLSPINLPMGGQLEVYTVYFYAENMGPMESRTYRVIPDTVALLPNTLNIEDKVHMENEYICVSFSNPDDIVIKDKKTGRSIHKSIGWEESADKGCSYVYIESDDKTYCNTDFPAVIKVVEDNEFRQRCLISWNAIFPRTYDFLRQMRTEETAVSEICYELILEKGCPYLQIGYSVDNHSCCHRIRMTVGSGLKNAEIFADSPFDIVNRRDSEGNQLENQLHPNTSFAALQDGDYGLAIFTLGQHDYEPIGTSGAALTICRSTGVISQWRDTVNKPFTPVYNPNWSTPGNQCLRKIEGRIGLFPYKGDLYGADVPNMTLKFRNSLLNIFVPEDRKQWTGGRPAVQDSAIEELFYYPEKYTEVYVDGLNSVLKINGKHIIRSALKKADDGNGFILRLYHYSDKAETVIIETDRSVYRTNLRETDNSEENLRNIAICAKPKELITLRIV